MRETWIDRWKGILICLVVLGHEVGMAEHFTQGVTKEFLAYIYKVIYCFHMPAFFCITGCLWRARSGDGFLTFCKKKVKRLLIPYFSFAILCAVIYYMVSGAFGAGISGETDGYYAPRSAMPTAGGLLLSIIHAGGWPDNGVFRANSVLWFLPAMFTVCVFYHCIDLCVPSVKSQILIAVGALIGSYYIPRNLPWGISLAPYYLPFLILGRWFIPKVKASEWGRIGQIAVIAGIYFGLCWIAPNTYWGIKYLLWRILFFVLAVLGICLSALVAQKVQFQRFAEFGVASLGIMLIHKYIILTLGVKLPCVRELYGQGGGAAVILAVVVTVIALVASYELTKLIGKYCPRLIGW